MNPTQPTGNDGQDAESSPAGPAAGTVVFPDRERALSAEEFRHLADVPPEVEWFANITNPRTRRAYRLDIEDFSKFAGIQRPEELRLVVRSHVIAWRNTLEQRNLSPATIRRKLSALSAIFNHLCIHSLRATAATNALDHEADIAKVQEWLGHADISTTRRYDRRRTRPEDSPTFKVAYRPNRSCSQASDSLTVAKAFLAT
jgi:hypothetical protein